MSDDLAPRSIDFHYTPVNEWLLALLVGLPIATLCFWMMGGDIRFAGGSIENLVALLAFGLALAMALYTFTGFVLSVSVEVDLAARYLQIRHLRLYGRHFERLHFHQIEKVRSRKARLNGRERYALSIVLKSGKTVKLNVPVADERQGAVKLIKEINRGIRAGR